MDGARTRGHPTATSAIGSMIRGRTPHAVLLVGPAGVGKTTLALDLAAGLLCDVADVAARPCGSCRGCRLVAHGTHPDLHRLTAEGPGRQVVIGGPGAKARGVRDLIAELALLPVEGGARVAIIESASRMNEDAQAALLKTLEEPPGGITIILCADAEDALLPTIRSRCARVRLGPVAVRDIEAILADTSAVEPALAARLARIAEGRPGIALAWAADPDALRARDELTRSLLDLTDQRPSRRLATVRSAHAGALAISASGVVPQAADPVVEREAGDEGEADPTTSPKAPPSERRRAAEALVLAWLSVARDLLLERTGIAGSTRELALLDETAAIADSFDADALAAFIDRLGRAGVLLANIASPELVLDDLALAWPHRSTAAA
jgi:DNA polymerase-3 subunit delta'